MDSSFVVYILFRDSPLKTAMNRLQFILWFYPLLFTLRDGIVQSVPCNCKNFLIYCAPRLSCNHSQFIHKSSLLLLQQRHLIVRWGETGREIATEFLPISICHTSRDLYHAIKPHNMVLTALFPLQRKLCYRFLSPLKIVLSRIWNHEPWVQW
jgi:hypothetical protein